MKKQLSILLISFVTYLFYAPFTFASWDSFLGDNKNSSSIGSKLSSFELKWEKPLEGSFPEHPYSPVADDNGNIYVPRQKGIYAYDKDGKELWRYTWESSTNKIYGSPVLLSDMIVFTADGRSGYAAALDKYNGSLIWSNQFEEDNTLNIIFTTSPAKSPDGTKIYVNTFSPGKMYGFDASDGSKFAEYQFLSSSTGKPLYSGIAVSSSGVVYTATNRGMIVALDGSTLDTIWTVLPPEAQKQSATTPTLSSDLTKIFVAINGVKDGKPALYALNIGDGSTLWSYQFMDVSQVFSSPVESSSGNVFINVGSNLQNNKLYAFDKNGSVLWIKEHPFGIQTSVSTDKNDQLYVNTDNFYVLGQLDGSQIFSHNLNNKFNTGAGSDIVLSRTDDPKTVVIYVIDALGTLFSFTADIPDDIAAAEDVSVTADICTSEYYCDSAPKYNPVLFVHGMGGKPEEWISGDKRAYRDKLLAEFRKKDPEFPEEWLKSYHYGFNRDGTYNYQGDVRDIARGMKEAVGQLSAEHKQYGGDGKVDLVGFSLGGMVIRQYLADNPTDHNIRRAILTASPHKGSWLMGVDRGIYSFPFIGKRLEENIANILLNVINSRKNYHPISQKSKAARMLIPGSDYLEGSQKLNDPKNTPSDIEYFLHAADIKVNTKHKFFFWTLERELSVGDGVVLKDSALGMPLPSGRDAERLAYGDTYDIDIKLYKLHGVYAFSINIPRFDSWKLFHTEFDKYGKLVDDVVGEILR